jgi:predicted PurR-regulated permease PerM
VKDHTSRPWVIFGGCILVVAVLHWAQAVLIPISVAVLLTFLLNPLVTPLERRVGRVAAVLAVVALAFSMLGLAAWGLTRQVGGLAEDLPSYRNTIRQKIADIRGASQGGSVERIQDTLKDVEEAVVRTERPDRTAEERVVVSPQAGAWSGLSLWIGSMLEPVATVGLVVVLVIFMLLERQDLRDRLIGLIGHGHVTVTTKALDEAATRVSQYLFRQTLVNLTFGVGVAAGLYVIGVPYWLFWASVAAVFRFIPYVGPWVGAGAPILVSFAALPGWGPTVAVIGLFVGLELLTNFVLETYLYAGAAGVSQVALLVAVGFWTWLWGPLGLLMATPLTVCVVVIGKHVPGLEFVATLMADRPALAPDVSYYQRLLARDQSEAADLLERQAGVDSPERVYDALMIPALTYAERDRIEGRLSPDEEAAVASATRELLGDVATLLQSARAARSQEPQDRDSGGARPLVLGYPANSSSDELALQMLAQLLEDIGISLEITSVQKLTSEVLGHIERGGYTIVCVADLPPSAPSRTRYFLKKLHGALPNLRIVVGRWAPPSMAEDHSPLLEAGATAVASTLLEARQQISRLARLEPPTPANSNATVA